MRPNSGSLSCLRPARTKFHTPGLTLILPRSHTGTVWFYTSTSNKRAARPKLYTKSLTRGLKLMYSRFTLVRISIKLNSSQLNMFREIILPIFRSTRLCVTACGVMHTPRCCRPQSHRAFRDPPPPQKKSCTYRLHLSFVECRDI